MPKLGLDEQKSNTRPVVWGHPAMDGDAQLSSGHANGRSGEARGKDSRLNLGGLSICLDDPDYRHGNMTGWNGRSHRLGFSVTALAFSPNGCRLASGSYDKTIKIWRVPVE